MFRHFGFKQVLWLKSPRSYLKQITIPQRLSSGPFKLIFLVTFCFSSLFADELNLLPTKNSHSPEKSEQSSESQQQLTSITGSEQPIETPDLLRQREQYLQALDHLRHGRDKEFLQLQASLADYVLAPYLERDYLLDRMSLKNRSLVTDFLDRYDNQPVAIRVRSKFLYLLARHDQTFLFLTYYRPTSDITLQCHWLRFRFKTKENRQDIINQAKSIWRYGKSRPDACDPVFQQMAKHGALTDKLIWERLILAIKSNNYGLTRYLTSKLSNAEQTTARYALQVYMKPKRLSKGLPKGVDAQKIAEIAAIVLSKNIWSKPDETLEIYENLNSDLAITHNNKVALARNIALSLASKNHPRASEWLNNIDYSQSDELLLRWKLAHELRQRNWPELQRWLAKTPAPEGSENDWLYWQARVESYLGNTHQAVQILATLSQRRSYYGFLASAHLGISPNLENNPYPFSEQMIAQLGNEPSAKRAYELWRLNRHLSARREWNHLKAQHNAIERKHLAALAHQWGWHEQVIFGLSRAGLYDSVDMRFPLAYQQVLADAAKDADIDVTFPLAIARKESAFMPDAHSRVGAMGLMQLMPYTAQYIAKKEQLPVPQKEQLTDPQTNVTLGTRYLKYLITEHHGNQVLATASYNAGKHKVADWLPQNEEAIPVDIWIETLPYKETRNYVKNVLAYQQIYRSLLGKEENYFTQLVQMEIKRQP